MKKTRATSIYSLDLSSMPCALLAGGEGKRLKAVLKTNTPKPMAIIERKPFLYYQIGLLAKKGFKDFLICTGIMASKIEKKMRDGSRLGITISYSEEKRPLGTAGAIKNAAPFLNRPFFLFNADTYLDIDYRSFLKFHMKNSSRLTIAVTKKGNSASYGAVKIDSRGRVRVFSEKKSISGGHVNAGAYIIDPEVLGLIPKNRCVSIENETIPLCVKNNLGVYGYAFRGDFYDIGTPARYKIFKDFIKTRRES